MIAPTMPGHRGRSGYESDKLPYSKTAARLAMQFQIGQELKARYEVPQAVDAHIQYGGDAADREHVNESQHSDDSSRLMAGDVNDP